MVELRLNIRGNTLNLYSICYKGIDHVSSFLNQAHEKDLDALGKLFRNLKETAENGPIDNDLMFGPLRKGLCEFKAGVLRLVGFELPHQIILTHGFFKNSVKTPKEQIDKGVWLKGEFMVAHQTNALLITETEQWILQ